MDDAYRHDDSCKKWLEDFEHYDARTAFRAITGDGQKPPSPPLPQGVQGTPSPQPDVFSDGSFTHLSIPHYGLASAAVWWPGRNTTPTELESVLADIEKRGDGAAVLGFVGGFKSSSTRIELFGVILAF